MAIAYRDQLARIVGNEGKLSGLREKLGASSHLNSELRTRVAVLEEACNKKDMLVKEWHATVELFETELHKSVQENAKLMQERELMRSTLQQVGSFYLDDQDGHGS